METITIKKIAIFFLFVITFASCKNKEDPCILPKADFSFDSSSLIIGDTIQLTNNSENATRFRWEIISNSITPSYFLESGNTVYIGEESKLVVNSLYDIVTIKLIAVNDCYQSDDATISISNVAAGTGTWVQQANYSGASGVAAVAFSIGDKGYIGTGQNSAYTDVQDFWEWDQTTNVWTQKANFGGLPRRVAVGFSIGTKGYIGTGISYGAPLKDFWEWDQVTNIWTQKSDFAAGTRYGAAGFSIGTKGYITNGDSSYMDYKNDLWEYDPSSDVWIQKSNFPGSVSVEAVGLSIGTKGYLWTNMEFWEYDPVLDVWVQKANFTGSMRYGVSGFSIGTKAYIGIGHAYGSSTDRLKDIWEWDQATNIWKRKADFGGGVRGAAVGFSIGAKGYIGIGLSSSFANDFWEFDPQ